MASGHESIGATVEARVGEATRRRLVTPTHGYLSQSDPTLTFALAAGETLTSLKVTWPSGAVQTLSGVPLNQITTVTEPQ
ncbi:MAG: ASPIC/UnbV domain-containing protein [Vicinamibacterales bacterium]